MPAPPEPDIAVRTAARLGQSPTWDTATDSLLWVDAASRTVHRFGPGQQDHVLEVPQFVGAAKPRSGRGLVLHLAEGVALFADDNEQRTWLVYWARDGFHGGATAVDTRGRLWASTRCENATGGGWLARVHGHGAARVAVDDVTTGTGLAWSPDDTRMYFVDGSRIDVFDFDAPSGEVSGRRTLCATGDDPRGLCVDTDGCLWVTVGAELRRYTPDGALDRSVPLPVRRPTGCCFGGTDITDLYVTSSHDGVAEAGELDGSVLVFTGLGEGLRATAFAG